MKDYRTELDKVENGNTFEVSPPMKPNAKIPPSNIQVNIKIFQDGKLIHEYKSGELPEDVRVNIEEPRNKVYELTDGESKVEHSFTASSVPQGDYQFEWNFGDGSAINKTNGKESNVKHIYKVIGKYTAKVTLYNQKGKVLSFDTVTIELKAKQTTTLSETPSKETVVTPASSSKQEYEWIQTRTRVNDWKTKMDYQNSKTSGWRLDVSASGGGATYKSTYIGTRKDMWMKNGMSESGTVTWSAPSQTSMKPNDIVSINLTSLNAPRDHSNFRGLLSLSAQFRRYNKDGKQIGNPTYFKDNNGLEVLGYISGRAEAPKHMEQAKVLGKVTTGAFEGQQMSICIKVQGGGIPIETEYVYEWKKQ